MSLYQTNTIDAIGVDNVTGDLVLTIIDPIDWSESNDEHLLLLQEKLNTYLSFVESGELLEVYPDARDRPVLIDVVRKYPLPQEAQELYSQVSRIVEGSGIKFRNRLFAVN